MLQSADVAQASWQKGMVGMLPPAPELLVVAPPPAPLVFALVACALVACVVVPPSSSSLCAFCAQAANIAMAVKRSRFTSH
jgi:hypothetical protein